MRRTTSMLAVCFCALTGCQGGGAQEPYDGVIVADRRPAALSAPAPQVPDTESIASEVDAPWAIALLSDAKAPMLEKASAVTILDTEPGVSDAIAADADLHVAVDPRVPEDKPAMPKTCSGVVKTRS